MERKRIDTARVYMVGMSAGGFMTSIMAAAYPDLFTAVTINAAGAYADASCLVSGTRWRSRLGERPAGATRRWAREPGSSPAS